MTQGIFVTGTDTGVGKTVVTAALAAALRQRGYRVGVMKPAESGCPEQDGRLMPQDALFLRAAAGCDAPLDVINPYTLVAPLAPALAAELEGVTIALEHIQACYAHLADSHDIVLVEGAGGLLVPLTAEATMLDLAVALGLPILVVARNVLGVINHTALTVAVARQRTRVLGMILNHPQPESALDSNAQSLRRWAGAPLLGEMPYATALAPEELASLAHQIDLDTLLER